MDRRTFARNLVGAAVAPVSYPSSAMHSRLALDPPAPGNAEATTAPFKVSVMMWTVFGNLPFEQRLEKVAEAGYRNVELVGEYKKWSDEEFQRINAKRKELGITFDTTAGLRGVAKPDDHDAILAALRAELVYMEKLDCPSLIVLSGNVIPGLPRQAQHDSCIEVLKKAAAVIEGKKINSEPVRLLLETIDPEENPKYFLTSMTEGFEIIKAVNHPQVQMLYDFFHEQIAEGNLIAKLERNIQYVGLVHIADVPGRHEPGTGEINYTSIFRKLGQLKYNRFVAMEFKPTSDPVQKLREAREMALAAGRV